MTTTKLISTAVLALAVFIVMIAPAQAQTVNQRLKNQHSRIKSGLQHGNLTHKEAHQLAGYDKSIHNAEKADRLKDGGRRLSGMQKARLQNRLNKNSARIYRAKHGGKVN